MIYNYPYFGFPNYTKCIKQKNASYSNYLKPNFNPQYNKPHIDQYTNYSTISHSSLPPYKNVIKSNNSINLPSSDNSEVPLFNLFGIQLYFDDVLLICILLFLYNEKIEDTYLLVALVLLLLS